MKPFDEYPNQGSRLLGKGYDATGNSRHGFGLKLMRLTGQTTCAYCGQSLVDSYAHWLLTTVDHVVPRSFRKEINVEWLDDIANLVLCCSGCNGFQWEWPKDQTRHAGTETQFIALRDEAFLRKKEWLASRREAEKDFFAQKPWEVDV